MRKLKCSKCGLLKNETEFKYDYWRKKYIKICSKCDNINNKYNNSSDSNNTIDPK